MVKYLPFILVAVILIAGVAFLRLRPQPVVEQPLTSLIQSNQTSAESRLTTLESAVAAVLKQSSQTTAGSNSSLETRVAQLESTISTLSTRITTLEKAQSQTTNQTTTTTTTNTNKSPLYIPLGSGSTTAGDWTNITTISISIDPANYAGYTNMQLESSLKVDQNGQAFARLGNSDDGTAILNSQISTTSTKDTWVTSSGFQLPAGKKTYVLQLKSLISNFSIYATNARIKVNFN